MATDPVKEAAIQHVYEKLKHFIQEGWNTSVFRQAAVNFLATEKEYEAQMEIYRQALNTVLHNSKLRSSMTAELTNWDGSTLAQLQKETQHLVRQEEKFLASANALMATQHVLLEEIRAFSGTHVTMIYMGGTSTDSITYDITDLLPTAALGKSLLSTLQSGQLASKKHFIDFRYNVSNMSKGQTVAERYSIQKETAAKLDALFAEINARIAWASTKKIPYLMWQVGNEWRKVKVKQLGDMKEAYTGLVAMGLANELPNDYDAAIDFFVQKYLSKVDSGQAFDTEDVQLSDVDYIGVKSGNASAPGYKRLIAFAQMLVTGEFNEKTALTLAKSIVGNTRNKIEKAVDAEREAAETAVFKHGPIVMTKI